MPEEPAYVARVSGSGVSRFRALVCFSFELFELQNDSYKVHLKQLELVWY